MPNLGPWEIGLILLIVLVIFGAGRLTEVGGALGRGIREFRRNLSGEDEREKEKKPETELDSQGPDAKS